MKTSTDLKKAATYLPPDMHEALRERAHANHRTVSTELKALVAKALQPNEANGGDEMTDNETHLTMALSHLRKVTHSGQPERLDRLRDYVNAVEMELKRIREEQAPA